MQLTQEDIKKAIYSRLKSLLIELVDPLEITHAKIMETEIRPLTRLETERSFLAYKKVLKSLEDKAK